MNKAKLTLLTLFLLFCSSVVLPAQVIPVEIEERIQSAHQMVLAKAVSDTSFWGFNKNIFTAVTMKVTAYMGYAHSDSLLCFIVPGGAIEDEVQIQYPGIQIKIGESRLETQKFTLKMSAYDPKRTLRIYMQKLCSE